MPRKPDRDLFRDSTMTFGEHLEDLRTCLFRALLWLVGGFLVGLAVAKPVMDFIKSPLEDALTAHYKEGAKKKLEKLAEDGVPLPGTIDQLTDLVAKEDVLPEAVFLQPRQLFGQLRQTYANAVTQSRERVEQFRRALELLGRLDLPANDPERRLSGAERGELSETVRLIPPTAPEEGLSQDELDGMVGSIDAGGDFPKDRVLAAVKAQEQRFQEDLARVVEASDLLDRTELPPSGAELHRSDLVQIFLWKPLEDDRRIQTKTFHAPEGFMIYIKAALLVGVLIASPGIFYNIWSFVAAGLYHHERRFVHVFGPFSLALFFAGAALVFFFVFQIVLQFLFKFNTVLGIGIEPRITDWLGFVLILPLGFGIAFQLPLVMLFLERIGVFDVRAYLEKWRIAILVIFIISMLLTPADPGSMMLMAIPLTVLYFGGVLLCKYMPRSRRPYDDDDFEEE
ncbi:twin-arginine translocase subunit TatC [Planctomycetota bacterium]